MDDEIRKLKREKGQVQTNLKLAENKLKGVLGIDANGTLPKAWENQLIKKSDLDNPIKAVLGLNPNDTIPSDWQSKLVPKDELDKWTNKFPNKSAQQVYDELNSKPVATVLAPEQQHKLDNFDTVEKKLLEFVRKTAKDELNNFYLKTLGIDDDPIKDSYDNDDNWKKKYGAEFNLEDVIDNNLTLENEEDAKKAFRVVACICATERVRELNETYQNSNPKPKKILTAIKSANNGWKKVEQYTQITKDNNPFYLEVIDKKWQECKRVVENLVQENQLQASQLQPLKTGE